MGHLVAKLRMSWRQEKGVPLLREPALVLDCLGDFWFSAFSKPSLNIWKFMVHILLKSGLENYEHYFASV